MTNQPETNQPETNHPNLEALEATNATLRSAPRQRGTVEMIVRRPAENEREVLAEAELDLVEGLVGDNWRSRRSSRTPDGSPHPDTQINIMSARAVAAVAGSRERWALAGDQLFLDLDLSHENLPAGTRLEIGTAVLEVTTQPHTGCAKFAERFGHASLRFVNSPAGKELRLRGLNAKVVAAGRIRTGDPVAKL